MLMWPFHRFGIGIPTYAVDNIVGEGTNVRGDLRGPGGFRIDGAVTGKVEVEGPVIVGEKGSIEGTLRARDIVILGRVDGDVVAQNHLEVGPRGRVTGDVTGTSVKVHPGGAFHGAIHVGEGGEKRLPAATNPIGILAPPVPGPAPLPAQGRTLPPPLGAVPPPPTTPAGPPIVTVTGRVPAVRAGRRESGETPIEPAETNEKPRKTAANDPAA